VSDEAIEQAVVAASRDSCIEVLLDYERYPVWAAEIKAARVLTTDEAGRGELVEYRVGGLGRSARLVLRYDYSELPDRLSWRLTDSDVLTAFDGAYDLAPVDDERTDVRYQIRVDLRVPIPSFVKRRAEVRVRRTALPELQAVLEGA